ncbi:hypothetical protein E4U43_008125 [Claviceps pusilla]|uniref:Integral membrane protein n=1 Tax=Claviceps pusilla TaxID=123648 RepID=A0A9P7SXK0_9HYPO|nr:hypothetical protein E4U43_008125 [Claviceps pusilla]
MRNRYARTHFYRDPGSRFFDQSRAYEQKYSQHRQTETTIASALGGLLPQERHDLLLNILIAHTDPTEHPTWHQQWVSLAVDNLFTYNLSLSRAHDAHRLQRWEQGRNFSEKGVFDYTYALEQCHKTGTPYVGIFEDDIMLAEGWLVHLLSGLSRLERDASSSISSSSSSKPWLYLRMFNQERSTGWLSTRIGDNHEHWIITALWLALAPPMLLARRRWKAAHAVFSPASMFVLLGLIIPSYVVLFFQSGKASLWPPRRGLADEPFGCCSQIMIFPREQVLPLMDFLRQKKTGQIDLLLNERAEEEGLTRYALYPVMAQHIGLDSARATTMSEAQAIWSMAYEDLNPETLRLDHRNMVDEYYGG